MQRRIEHVIFVQVCDDESRIQLTAEKASADKDFSMAGRFGVGMRRVLFKSRYHMNGLVHVVSVIDCWVVGD